MEILVQSSFRAAERWGGLLAGSLSFLKVGLWREGVAYSCCHFCGLNGNWAVIDG